MFVGVVVFVTPLAPRLANCRVVAAPRLCEASRAGIRIVSQELAKPCVYRVIFRISGEEASVERFEAMREEKSGQRWS